jgi:CheY-like chemotaxis protein
MVVTTKTMLRRLIGEDIDLVTNLQEPIAKIKTDPGQLEQIIMNLAINARDAMPQGGRLTIETANVRLSEIFTRRHPDLKPGAYVRLIVSDTGIGMDQMIMSHLFEPFFTTKEAGKGTGLGLATVHGIVKQNNGHITVHSEPGRGSSFKLYFPQVKESILVEETNEGRPRKYQGTETLLIVEDEAIVRELAHRILSQRGYHVIAAGNGQEALQICRNYDEPIDLMITDVVMPGMSGRDLAEQAAPIRPDMKILFISGYPNDIIAEHGILSDGISFLQKPFSPDSLTAKVQGILDRPAKIQMPPPNEGVLHLYRNGH